MRTSITGRRTATAATAVALAVTLAACGGGSGGSDAVDPDAEPSGELRVLKDVVLPIVRPTLAVLFIFFFIWVWNEFYFSLIFLTSSDTQTIPLAIALLRGDRVMDVPTINAGSLVSLLPAVIFFLIFQRTLTRGLTAGALK